MTLFIIGLVCTLNNWKLWLFAFPLSHLIYNCKIYIQVTSKFFKPKLLKYIFKPGATASCIKAKVETSKKLFSELFHFNGLQASKKRSVNFSWEKYGWLRQVSRIWLYLFYRIWLHTILGGFGGYLTVLRVNVRAVGKFCSMHRI